MYIRVVVVGSGRAGRELHVPYFKEIKDCEVTALCDPQVEWTKSVAKQLGVKNVYPTLREALEKEKADTVSICSIPQKHLEDVLTAFEFGCHVLLEKPMALSPEDAKKMKAAGDAAGKVFSVVHNYKFTPGIRQAMDMVRAGSIGEVIHVRSNWLKEAETDRMASAPGHWSQGLKGGRWAETLPHNVYLIYQAVGPMKLRSVEAKTVCAGHPWLHPDSVEIILEHERGYAEILLSANVKASNSDIMITGSRGAIICDYLAARALSARISSKKILSENTTIFERATSSILRKIGVDRGVADPTGHRTVINGFVNEVLHGSKPTTLWEEAYHTMELVDSIGERIGSADKSR